MTNLQDEFGTDNLIYVDYHILQALSSDDTRARKDFYGVGGTPTVFFNGGTRTVGSSPPPYSRYRDTILSLLGQTAQLSVLPSLVPVLSEDRAELSIELEVGDEETITNPEECVVRALIYEDMVSAGATYDHVVRVVPIEVPLTISGPGQMITISEEIALDPSWKQEDLSVVAWVQRDTNQDILNAAVRKITDPTPTQSATLGSVKAGFRSR